MDTSDLTGANQAAGDRGQFLYERICQRLLNQIRGGAYADGERLPSVRRMSRLFGVSINTVMQSYRKLEADGILEARPQSGFFLRSSDVDAEFVSAAERFPLLPVEVSLSEHVLRYMELHAQPDIVKLGIALPCADILPVQRVLRTLIEVVRQRPDDAWDYMHPHGDPALLHHLARRSLAHDVAVAPEDIIITSGCMEALTLALRCISRPGDAIAVESPTYYGTLLLLEAHGRRVVEVPTSPTGGIALDQLERVFARGDVAGCLFSANAQNPLGFTMTDEHKRGIVALSARYEIPLIENDVWGDTVYDATRATPAKAFDRDGLVLYCNSFSKTLIPGFRLGWAIPGRFHRRFQELKQLSTITSASAPQIAVGRLLESGFYEQHIRELRVCLREQVHAYAAEVRRVFPAGTRINGPSGGCVLWIRLPKGVSAATLFEQAAGQGIHVFPGTVFSADGEVDDHLRINAGTPLDARIRAALQTLGRLVQEMTSAR